MPTPSSCPSKSSSALHTWPGRNGSFYNVRCAAYPAIKHMSCGTRECHHLFPFTYGLTFSHVNDIIVDVFSPLGGYIFTKRIYPFSYTSLYKSTFHWVLNTILFTGFDGHLSLGMLLFFSPLYLMPTYWGLVVITEIPLGRH